MSNVDSSQKQTVLPDVGDIIFLLVAQFMLYLRPTFLFGDGSTGWHLVAGKFILNNHVIPQHDLISYTFANKAWVDYEWLSDALMALATNLGGLNMLAVLVSASIALLFLLLYERCRKEGSNFLFALFITVCGALVSSIHWLARPIIFTFFGVYLFTTKLEDFYSGKINGRKLLLYACLTMLVWVNTHPTFLIGLGLTGIYLAGAMVSFLRARLLKNENASTNKIRTIFAVLIACLGITLINPYGIKLYSYIANYLKGSSVIAATNEFTSPIFHGGLQTTCLEILFFLLVVGLFISNKRLTIPRFLCCVLFAHLALSGLRNMPLFVIVALPAIAELYSSTKLLMSPDDRYFGWFLAIKDQWNKYASNFHAVEAQCQLHLLPIAFVATLIAASLHGGWLCNFQLVNCEFDPQAMPTRTLEYVLSQKLDPRAGLNYDNWGGYINYKYGIPVFIDDRSDFYGEPFYYEYAKVSQMDPGWNDVLNKYNIQWVLFPKNSRVSARLSESPDWTIAVQDRASCLMIRKPKPL